MHQGGFIVILCLVISSIHATNVRGVFPSQIASYQGQTFKCLGGTKTIPIEAVNDDYCDCQDSSDEPGTSACPNGRYFCINAGHVAQSIFSSRVNDGICDCCDGSDEYLSSICKNTCKEAWEQSTIQIRIDIQEHERGIDFTKQKQQAYLSEVDQKHKELVEKKDKKSTLSPKVDDLQSRKTNLQHQIDEKTEEIKQQTAAQIEPQVEAKFQEKQAEKARIAAEAEAKVQSEPVQPESTEKPQVSEGGHDDKPAAPEVSEEEKQKKIEEEKSAIRKDLVEEQLQQCQPLQAIKDG